MKDFPLYVFPLDCVGVIALFGGYETTIEMSEVCSYWGSELNKEYLWKMFLEMYYSIDNIEYNCKEIFMKKKVRWKCRLYWYDQRWKDPIYKAYVFLKHGNEYFWKKNKWKKKFIVITRDCKIWVFESYKNKHPLKKISFENMMVRRSYSNREHVTRLYDNKKSYYIQSKETFQQILLLNKIRYAQLFQAERNKLNLPKICKISYLKWNQQQLHQWFEMNAINFGIEKSSNPLLLYEKLKRIRIKDLQSLKESYLVDIVGIRNLPLRKKIMREIRILKEDGTFNYYYDNIVLKKVEKEGHTLNRRFNRAQRRKYLDPLISPEIMFERLRNKINFQKVKQVRILFNFRKENSTRRLIAHILPTISRKDDDIITSIIIGNCFLEWRESSIIMPRKIPFNSRIIKYGTEPIKFPKSMTEVSLERKISELSSLLCNYNKTMHYNIKSNPNERYLKNSQEFVDDVLTNLNLSYDSIYYSGLIQSNIIKRIRDYGYLRNMCFNPSPLFRKKFLNDEEYVIEYLFKTHSELDDFARKMIQIDEIGFKMDFIEEYKLLLCFDRLFWLRYNIGYSSSIHYVPSKNEPSKNKCPFDNHHNIYHK